MSKIDRATRRDFLKKATLAASAVGLRLPVSNASPAQAASQDLQGISVQLAAHPSSSYIRWLHGANGCPTALLPGYPELGAVFQTMGIADIRTHDWFGVADLDGKLTAERLQQPVYAAADPKAAQAFLADVGNKRVLFLRADQAQGDNFAATDHYLASTQSSLKGVEILFRIGRSLGAGNVYPTSGQDLEAYLDLVKKTVRRYAVDYAQYGLSSPVSYWEIGNEPDEGDFFSGDAGDFYHYFAQVYFAIKSVSPFASVGGSGVANLMASDGQYVKGFLDYCNDNNVALDFFSWHYYGNQSLDPYDYLRLGRLAKKAMQESGFQQTLSFLTEWNMTPLVSQANVSALQGSVAASFICSALIYLQDALVDKAYFYRADAMHLGLVNREHAYTCSAKAFIAFNQLRATPYRLMAGAPQAADPSGQNSQGIVVLAGADADPAGGQVRKVNILLANYQLNRDYLNNYDGSIYSQYTLDTSVAANQIDQSYYGGADPDGLVNENSDEFHRSHSFPEGALPLQSPNGSGEQGLELDIYFPAPSSYASYRASFAWVSEHSDLDQPGLDSLAGAAPVSGAIPGDGRLTLKRPELTPGRILLISLELS